MIDRVDTDGVYTTLQLVGYVWGWDDDRVREELRRTDGLAFYRVSVVTRCPRLTVECTSTTGFGAFRVRSAAAFDRWRERERALFTVGGGA